MSMSFNKSELRMDIYKCSCIHKYIYIPGTFINTHIHTFKNARCKPECVIFKKKTFRIAYVTRKYRKDENDQVLVR